MYEKRMIILTGEKGEKGTLKAERKGNKLYVQINTANVEENDYMLAVTTTNERTDYPLGLLPSEVVIEIDSNIDVSNAHFTVYKRNGNAVLYGTLQSKRLWWGNLPCGEKIDDKKTSVVDAKQEIAKTKNDVSIEKSIDTTTKPTAPQVQLDEYDDNAIATENYYELDKIEQEKIGVSADKIQEETMVAEEKIRGRKATFYENHAHEIERLFASGERVTTLEKQLPYTKWVKVRFGSGRHYVVGIIGQKPDYLCYGLPGIYGDNAPKILGDDAIFLPLNPLRPQGEGYWLTYQDAETGTTVGK